MKNKSARTLALTLSSLAFAVTPVARPCSTFQVTGSDGGKLYGRNLDYPTGVGLLSVNARNLRKTAFLVPGAPWRPAAWTARFGSVSFSQIGRELPYGGMNERGLVVETMVLNDSRYPSRGPDEPTVTEAGLVQYLLDTQETAAGAVAAARELAVHPAMMPLHYLVCDAAGSCATLEFIDGELSVNAGAAAEGGLPVAGLTNDTYADSLAFLARHEGFGGHEPIPSGTGSLARFARVARDVRDFRDDGDAVASAYRILDGVAQPAPNLSVWQIVYDQGRLEVHFRTQARPERATVRLADLSFDCRRRPEALDLDGSVMTPARTWLHDDAASRLAMAHLTMDGLGREMPEAWLQAAAAHAESLQCVE